jgi:HAD superfamily hydrolase (TIGR01490 family)
VAAAFFDLDKTVIARASMVAFGRPLYREGLLSRWLLIRALYGQLTYLWVGASEKKLVKMRDTALRLTKGWHQERIRSIVSETLPEVIDPIVYEEALELIREHRAQGHRVVIVSASPTEIVEPLGEYLGADEALGTEARVDGTGRYTGEMSFYCYGANKAVAMERIAARDGFSLADCWAYSDSMTDLPMLEVVGHPVAVNPDRDLGRIASERGWDIRWFVEPVRLRDRVPMPSPRAAAVGGGVGAAVTAAAIAAWWWLRRDEPPPSARERVVRSVTGMLSGAIRPAGWPSWR